MSAIVLNLIFRVGIAKSRVLTFTVGQDDSQTIIDFMEKQGGLWGVRWGRDQNRLLQRSPVAGSRRSSSNPD